MTGGFLVTEMGRGRECPVGEDIPDRGAEGMVCREVTGLPPNLATQPDLSQQVSSCPLSHLLTHLLSQACPECSSLPLAWTQPNVTSSVGPSLSTPFSTALSQHCLAP